MDGRTARLDTLQTDVHNSAQQCNKSFICNIYNLVFPVSDAKEAIIS